LLLLLVLYCTVLKYNTSEIEIKRDIVLSTFATYRVGCSISLCKLMYYYTSEIERKREIALSPFATYRVFHKSLQTVCYLSIYPLRGTVCILVPACMHAAEAAAVRVRPPPPQTPPPPPPPPPPPTVVYQYVVKHDSPRATDRNERANDHHVLFVC
jgi:hypothetical protein